jgi:hypothetical protein
MLLFILKNAIISIILIILLHYIYDYFKTNLTTPKVKDLVNKPQIQYDEIIKTIKESKDINHNELIEKEEKNKSNMKNELKKFMDELNETNDIPLSMSTDELYQSF